MKKKYIGEIKKLAIGLMERGMQFEFREMSDGGQIIVYEKTGRPYSMAGELIRKWDAVCHNGSYGREEGLLEIMGELVDEEEVGDTVEGWLTAAEILERVDRRE